MNKTDLVDELALMGTPRKEAATAVDRVLNAISRSLACGERVTIRDFGKFEPRTRRPVVRKNPQTGVPIHIPERVSIGFVAAPALKKRINR